MQEDKLKKLAQGHTAGKQQRCRAHMVLCEAQVGAQYMPMSSVIPKTPGWRSPRVAQLPPSCLPLSQALQRPGDLMMA